MNEGSFMSDEEKFRLIKEIKLDIVDVFKKKHLTSNFSVHAMFKEKIVMISLIDALRTYTQSQSYILNKRDFWEECIFHMLAIRNKFLLEEQKK